MEATSAPELSIQIRFGKREPIRRGTCLTFQGDGKTYLLETHYSQALKPGMMITLEPGIYIPEEKLSVRIEDMYWVDPNGMLVKLTAGLPSGPGGTAMKSSR